MRPLSFLPDGRRRLLDARSTRRTSPAAGRFTRSTWRPARDGRSRIIRSGSSTASRASTARACSGSRTRPVTSPATGSRSRSTEARRDRFSTAFRTDGTRGSRKLRDRRRGDLGSRRIRDLRLARRRSRARAPSLRATPSGSVAHYDGGFLRGALSRDGDAARAYEHSEHGDLIHPALRVVDPRTGSTVGDLLDEGMALDAKCWSPIAGDAAARVRPTSGTVTSRPGIWNLSTGERTDLDVGLEGATTVGDWWPDGSALLLVNLFEGRSYLYRYELATGALARRCRRSLGTSGRRAFAPTAGVVRPRAGPPAAPRPRRHRRRGPHARRFRRLRRGRTSPGTSRTSTARSVHGFYVTPDDSGGPFPVMMFVHGGPSWLDLDRWQPEVQAYVDAGFVVGLVNYRGSIGYGREWRDTLIGNIGGPELEDVNAGLRDLVARGLADPERAVIAGYSWGGYVTLLEVGKHPELWRCGDRRRARRGLRGRVRRAVTAPPGVRQGAPRRHDPEGGARPHARPQRDQLRRRRAGACSLPHRAERLAAARTARRWRTSTGSPRASIRTRCTCTRPGTRRSTCRRAREAGRHGARLPRSATFPAFATLVTLTGSRPRPGSSLPSRSSSDAPPPVETHETRSASPSSEIARTESPPPTTVNASASATACATAFVPPAKRGHSKTPIGPFQKTVRAVADPRAEASRASPDRCRDRASPRARRRTAVTRLSASASNAAAATTSVGSSAA